MLLSRKDLQSKDCISNDLVQVRLTWSGMLISTLRFVPSAKRHSEVMEILRSVVGPAESQPGCLGCRIYMEDGPDQATVMCGHWKTSAALQEHICSDLYLRVLAACELSRLPPEFCFYHVSKTQGIDLIHQLRGSDGDKLPALQ
jgi:quinol monooxygenase YgiN